MQEVALVGEKGWDKFVTQRCGQGDMPDMEGVGHLVCCLLYQYRHRGRAVVIIDI